jgi:hypothetical protein
MLIGFRTHRRAEFIGKDIDGEIFPKQVASK